jgi:uncharacterized protein YuzE
MSEPLLAIEVDQAAETAYLRLNRRSIAKTEEFNDWILVDLDEFDMVVGVEFLNLTYDIPLEALMNRYHIKRDAADLLLAVEHSFSYRTKLATAGQSAESPAQFGAVLPDRSSGAWHAGTAT